MMNKKSRELRVEQGHYEKGSKEGAGQPVEVKQDGEDVTLTSKSRDRSRNPFANMTHVL